MDRKIYIGIAVVVIIAAAGLFFILNDPKNTTLAHVDDLHMQMSPASLGELEAIIKSSAAPYTRERAVGVYADIASRSGNEKRALAFLKEVAIQEKDTDVRTSAYSYYYWVRDMTGTVPETTVDVRVEGSIRAGSDFRVILLVTSLHGCNLSTVGMAAAPLRDANITNGNGVEVDANAGKGALTNVKISPSNRIRKPLPANVTVEFPYTISVTRPGQAMLQVHIEAPNDQLDYDAIERKILIDAGTSGGMYSIRD